MFNNILYSLKMSLSIKPVRVVLDFIVRLIFRSYTVFYGVFFLGYVLNIVESGNDVIKAWILVGITILFMVSYDYLAAWYYNTYKPYVDQEVFRNYRKLVYNKASSVDLQCFENTDFYNQYTRVSEDISGRFESVLEDCLDLILDILMNTYLLVTVFMLDIWAVMLCFAPIAIKYIIGNKLNAANYELYDANIDPNRKKGYVKRTVYLKEYCKELHTSNIFAVLSEKFRNASQDIISNTKKFGPKIAIMSFLNSTLINVFTYFTVIIYASYKAIVVKSLSIGDYIILVNAISRLSSMLVGFVDRIIRFNEHSRYITKIRAFLDLRSELEDGDLNIETSDVETIEIKNVSFKYSGQCESCLKNVNMSIGKGEKIAIVGLNGAGKTTLIKLLMRLYDVTDGEILLNGSNIKKYQSESYRSIFSSVFQDYKIFAATVSENVLLDINNDRKNDVETALLNSDIYEKLSEECGGDINNAILTREFDNNGIILSGGQFQKIAIARAFIKEGGIAILDEPSSALDPIAERQMFENLLNACHDKTIIFISHRLSAAALADKIYVMQNGTFAESGTHDSLMEAKGIYYDMYIKQNKKFTASEGCYDE